MSRTGRATRGCTDYIHGRCARQDPRAYIRLLPRANPQRSHTTHIPHYNLNLDNTEHHSGRGSAIRTSTSPGITRVRAKAVAAPPYS